MLCGAVHFVQLDSLLLAGGVRSVYNPFPSAIPEEHQRLHDLNNVISATRRVPINLVNGAKYVVAGNGVHLIDLVLARLPISVVPRQAEVNEVHLLHQRRYPTYGLFLFANLLAAELLLLLGAVRVSPVLLQNFHDGVLVVREHDVVRFDVAVDDSDGVQLADVFYHGDADLDDVVEAQIQANFLIKVSEAEAEFFNDDEIFVQSGRIERVWLQIAVVNHRGQAGHILSLDFIE